MAVKKTQMYRRNLDGTETNLNPLTESQYVLMENGQTVQEVLSDRDSDKYTPVITNSSSTFKVGQGDNVDLSSSMKEGAYDSCVLKGKTMVNCIQEPSSKDVVLPYEFVDGQYVTINDTKESGALGVELKGQTLVNLIPEGRQSSFHINNVSGGGYAFWDSPNVNMIKPSTKYLVLTNVTLNTGSKIVINNNEGFISCFTDGIYYEPNEVGIKKTILTSKSDLSNCTTILRSYTHMVGEAKGTIQVFEYQEGMEHWDIPYFTGMTSIKMPILKTIGKNLFSVDIIENNRDNSTGEIFIQKGYATTSDFIPILPNHKISFSLKDDERYRFSQFFFYDENKNFVSRSFVTNIVTPNNAKFLHMVMAKKDLTNDLTDDELDELKGLIQLEYGDKTSHEPYKSSILSLPEEVVLRSLPNGVCDTFNTRTGVYTQRIGEVVLNGGEEWRLNNTEGTTTQRFFCSILTDSGVDSDKKGTQQFLCDGLKTITWSQTCELGVTINGSGVFVYNNSIEYTVSSVKQWLSQTPVKLQYELATPVITKINLSSTLKSWNTTTHVYSEIPESTLYPILSYSNPSYPVILKPSTKYSIVANSYSNSHTNSTINFNLGGATASTVVGNRVTTITTPSTLSNELLTMSGRGNKLNNVMVIEGDVVGDEPYFEGICNCKSPTLTNVGKNLFLGTMEQGSIAGSDGQPVFATTRARSTNFIKLKKDNTYTFSVTSLQVDSNIMFREFLTYSIDNYNSYKVGNLGTYKKQFTYTPTDDEYIKFVLTNNTTPEGVVDINAVKIQIEQNTQATVYEDCKSNTTTFSTDDNKTIVLRSLPNGVCDTLNVETGEYVQRIGEIVFDGSEDERWKRDLFTRNEKEFLRFRLDISNVKTDGLGICNKLPTFKGDVFATDYVRPSTNLIWVYKKDTTQTLEELIADLQVNPVTVQYELATPITTTVDISGYPFAYKNGHVLLESGSQEQSLTPAIEYSLSANKTGQIDSNTRQVIRQQKKIDDFEALMLTQIVESYYDKAILQFDYEMQMLSLGGERNE